MTGAHHEVHLLGGDADPGPHDVAGDQDCSHWVDPPDLPVHTPLLSRNERIPRSLRAADGPRCNTSSPSVTCASGSRAGCLQIPVPCKRMQANQSQEDMPSMLMIQILEASDPCYKSSWLVGCWAHRTRLLTRWVLWWGRF